MATAEITVKVENMPAVRRVVEAAVAVCNARAAGADCYEANAEIDALQESLNDLAHLLHIPTVGHQD